MELRIINTFLHIAELRSFSRAARELGYSQSAVSAQIAQLEAELETPLFDRVGLLHLETPIELATDAYSDLRIFAGYAGWAPGQLQGEVAQGMWHPVAARHADVFDSDPESLWRRVLARQGGELGWLATWTPTPELN